MGNLGDAQAEPGGRCQEADKHADGCNSMWSLRGGKGKALEAWEDSGSGTGTRGSLFNLVQFPELCRICSSEGREEERGEAVCESPLYQELKNLDPEGALSVACTHRQPSERRFGLELLAVLAENEEWTLKGGAENQYLGCLQGYLNHQFLRLVEEGKVVQRVDESGRATWACFCTGLLSRDNGELLYCLAKRSESDGAPWLFHGFLTSPRLQDPAHSWNAGSDVMPLPSKASFCSSVSDLVFDLGDFHGKIDADSEVWRSLEAIRGALPRPFQDADLHSVQRALVGAVQRSVNRVKVDPFLLVPQFVREESGVKIQALLPLQVDRGTFVALVLDVEREGAESQTLIPRRFVSTSEAYANARILGPQHQPWILTACLSSSPPGGRNTWQIAPRVAIPGHSHAQDGTFPGHSHGPPGAFPGHSRQQFTGSRFPQEDGPVPSSKPVPSLAGLHIDPPDAPNALHPEECEKGHFPSSRGSSDAWVTGSGRPGSSNGTFHTSAFGSGPSSESGQSLSPQRLSSPPRHSPPLEEQRAYSHQEARAEQVYREMVSREGANTLRDVNNLREMQAAGNTHGMGGFTSGPMKSAVGPDTASENFGRGETLLRLYGGYTHHEGGVNKGNQEGADRWLAAKEKAVRFNMAYAQERLGEMDREAMYGSEVGLPGGPKPPTARPPSRDPWAREYPAYSPEGLDHRSDKEDSIFVEFSPQDDLCPKVNISQLPAKFVATFLSGDANRPGFEYNAEQYAEQLFSRYGAVSKTLVRENKNHPGKWFAIVEFSYWTNEEVRQRLVAGEQIRFANFFDGEDVYVRRHKDKQSKMLRNGSGGSSGLPCRPDWKYTGTDTRLGKPLYRGPCSMCGRESTVPFKPVVNGQPPRCRTCLPQEGSNLPSGGGFSQANGPPLYGDSGLMSLRKETLRTLSGARVGGGMFLSEGVDSGRNGPRQYGVERSLSMEPSRLLGERGGFADISRTQSFGGDDVSKYQADVSKYGSADVSKFGVRDFGGLGEQVSRLAAHPPSAEYRRATNLGNADWSFSHPGERESFQTSDALTKAARFEADWADRRGAFPGSSSSGFQGSGVPGGKFTGQYQHSSYLD